MLQQQSKAAALYCRFSRDDLMQGDSASIQTQKAMLAQFAKQNGLYETVFYVDDGYTGTNFERPDFQKLLSDIESGRIGTVITKDLSRLGRNYLQTGFYTECYFPDNQVRYIAINDNVDTSKGENEFAPFRNIMNEWYARDNSRKVKSAYRTKAIKGEFTGPYAPYGYKKSPEDKHKLIIDEEVAPNVRKIYELAASGVTLFRISMYLKKQGILKPRAYMINKMGKYVSEKYLKYPNDWATETIRSIIINQEYLGHLVCNKNTSKSFKDRKLIAIPKDQWIITRNTHEPIIDQETFDKAQKMALLKRKSVKETGTHQIFVGLLRCPTCGMTLGYNKRYERYATGSYACSTYRRFGKTYCSMHYITYENLYDVVLKDIKKHANAVNLEPERLLKHLTEQSSLKNKKQIAQSEREISKAERRIIELDNIVKRLYEDNVSDKISDDRFNVMLKDYENEQAALRGNLIKLKQDISAFSGIKDNSERFAEVIKKYCDIQELNETILNELIDKILIHEREIINGERKQKIEIYYNFVGII